MKKHYFGKILALVIAVCMLSCCLVACGGKEMALTVNDRGTKTEVTANVGSTVAQVLEKAQITLGEKDETEPAKDAKITEDVKEIIVKRYAKITVVLGDEKKEIEVVGGTVEDAIKKAGYTLDGGITSDTPATDYVKDGMTITLTKGLTVELTMDGKTTTISTSAKTVADLANELKLGADDELSEKAETAITDGMKLTVRRVEYKEVKETEKISFETEERYSDSISSGSSEVTQEGVDGEKEVTYKVKYVDGKEDSRKSVSEKVTKEPVNKIVTYGTSDDSGYSDGGNQGGGSDSTPTGRTVVSRQQVPDCDGSGHGYYIITYSDGSEEYEEY
ncbi:MAG: G5 domain-containing protein [Ruminococcus sp.]|nr:G5 domain-containing protein [Ruminococcus sp.]